MEAYKIREYPLEVERSADGDLLYSKGFQNAEEFAVEAMKEAEWWEQYPEIKRDDVRYEVWRVVPDPDGDYNGFFHPAQLGTPGAFPVTYTHI